MSNTCLSVREIMKIVKIIKSSLGKGSVVPNVETIIKERNNEMENVMVTKMREFINSEGEKKSFLLQQLLT